MAPYGNKMQIPSRVIGTVDKYKVVDIFPYKIKNLKKFIFRDHVPYVQGDDDSKLYARETTTRCVEGHWVYDCPEGSEVGTWVYMMPKLYFFANLATVVSGEGKTRKPQPPDVTDIEWIIFSYILCVDGFSGFEDDPKYTCNIFVRDINDGREYPDKVMQKLEKNCKTPEGEWKEYINAWDYLTYVYLLGDPRDFPLGKPLYENNTYNGMILATRGGRKSYCLSAGDCMHELWTDGAMYVEDIKGKPQVAMFLGSVDTEYIDNFLKIGETCFTNIPGIGNGNHYWLTKTTTPNWDTKRGHIERSIRIDDGTYVGSGSYLAKAVIQTNKAEIVVAKRTKRIYVDECGLQGNILEVYEASAATLKSPSGKFGALMLSGCVCAGTRVWNRRGDLVNIEDLKQEDGIVGHDLSTHTSVGQPISYMQPPTSKQCYRITTTTGRHLECSDDHPIFARTRFPAGALRPAGWARTDFLQKGDKVAVVDNVDIWGAKTMRDPRLVGLLIGDGSYGLGNQPYTKTNGVVTPSNCGGIMLANSDPEVWNYVESKYTIRQDRESRRTSTGKDLRKCRILGFVDEMRQLGIQGQTKLNKRLPENIHSYTKETVLELLGGYYDADGCIYYDEETGYSTVKLTSISKELIEEVQLLLTKLGIHAGIRVEAPRVTEIAKGKYPTYNLYVKDTDSLRVFSENIKLLIKYKQDKLNKIKERCISVSGKKNKRLTTYPGLRFELIASVEDIGIRPIYNLTADGTNTYVANGIFTHNTGGNIEKIAGNKTMYHNPKTYDIFPIPNYWFDGADIGLFIPASYKWDMFKDENGNTTDLMAATKYVLEERIRLSGGDIHKQTGSRMNEPLEPAEIFLSGKGDYFDKDLIIDRIDVVERHLYDKVTKYYDLQLGRRLDVGYDVIAKQVFGKRHEVLSDPTLDNGRPGRLAVFEPPMGDGREFLPYDNLYKVVLDPKTDSLTGTSYHKIIVWKGYPRRALEPNEMFNTIVAEAKIKDDGLLIFMLLCLWYKSRGQYERNVNGIPDFFDKYGLRGLLQPTPLAYIKDVNPGSKLVAQTGIPMGDNKDRTGLKSEGLKLLDKLHKTVIHKSEDGDIIRSAETWNDLSLLYEMNYYNDEGNFDSVSAMLVLCIWLQSEYIPEGADTSSRQEEDTSWEDLASTANRILR